MSGDFDNDDSFDDLNDDGFEDFKPTGGGLRDIWDNNPILKVAAIGIGLIIVIVVIVILTRDNQVPDSYIGSAPEQRDAPGGQVSEAYAEAIETINQERRDRAFQNIGESVIPIPYNLQDQSLSPSISDGPTYDDDFDPLAAWRQQLQPEVAPQLPEPEPETGSEVEPELEFVPEPEPIFVPYEGTNALTPVPGPSPEAVAELAQAMMDQMAGLVERQAIQGARLMSITNSDFLQLDEDGSADDLGDSRWRNGNDISGIGITPGEEEVVETILVPAGTINYAQMLVEANSDIPGPVLAQLVSGPLSGARLIGSFTATEEHLILTFNTIIVDGLNQSISAVAIDPNTTLTGIATDVEKRYWSRIILPAAARFIEGLGSAISQTTDSVTTSGNTTTYNRSKLDWKQQLGKGAEEGASKIGDFLEDRGDQMGPLIRVARGTPIGIFFMQPVLEQE